MLPERKTLRQQKKKKRKKKRVSSHTREKDRPTWKRPWKTRERVSEGKTGTPYWMANGTPKKESESQIERGERSKNYKANDLANSSKRIGEDGRKGKPLTYGSRRSRVQ